MLVAWVEHGREIALQEDCKVDLRRTLHQDPGLGAKFAGKQPSIYQFVLSPRKGSTSFVHRHDLARGHVSGAERRVPVSPLAMPLAYGDECSNSIAFSWARSL